MLQPYRRRRGPKPDRRLSLELLAASPEGCTEALMFANGFTAEPLVEHAERMVAGGKMMEAARVEISEAGWQALAGEAINGTAKINMRRRAFITLLGGAAAAWPLMARAQQVSKLPTIGFLGAGSGSDSVWKDWTAGFVYRLRELGWVEGRTVVIEYRWGEGRAERYADLAAEFVGLKVDVIVTSGSAAVAVKRATSVIPIVFATANEPIGSGLVASLARPGGNATGMSVQQTDLAGKRLELLREIVPGLRRLGILIHADNAGAVLDSDQVRAAAGMLGLEVLTGEIQRAEEIAPTFEAFKERAQALYIVGDALMSTYRIRINTLALAARLPSMYPNRAFVETGGLVSYGPNFPNMYRRAGDYVDKILRGRKPAEIPVEQPTKFDLVVNLTTAKALGLEVPPTLLARADEVIE